MGRVLGFLAGVVSVARLLVDALQVAATLRRGGAQEDTEGAPDVGGATEAGPAGSPGRVGPSGEAAGPGAGQERAGTDGAVSPG